MIRYSSYTFTAIILYFQNNGNVSFIKRDGFGYFTKEDKHRITIELVKQIKQDEEALSGAKCAAFTLRMVCLIVLNSRAMALILIPESIRAITARCCSSFSAEGRPNRFPAAFALNT